MICLLSRGGEAKNDVTERGGLRDDGLGGRRSSGYV